MTCASDARSCATCWSSSPRCTIRQFTSRQYRELKGLQDCLGEFQDCQVQQHEIRMFAAQMMTDRDVPATALLAMGELAARSRAVEQPRPPRVRGPVR